MIRNAVINDLDTINEIYNEAISLKATADTEPIKINDRVQWYYEHKSDKYPIFVYEFDNKVVGWISVSAYRPGRKALEHTAEISYYIDCKYKRQGIATKLINYIIDNCSYYDIRTIFAIVLEHNIPSIMLLEKFKFKQWGKLPNVANFDGEECGHLYYGLRLSNQEEL
jgi:phosphinothricin acetyltransferase